ncbi:MAG TPA: ABC transporter permease [Aliidongia sp.]|nr:ABC transporter permease [Aliidongia sp.]
MLKNYLSAAWRNAVRDRLHATINVLGLALGLAAAILIALFVRDELSADRFIPGHDRVFRVTTHLSVPGRTPVWYGKAPEHTAPALVTDFPEFEGVSRVVSDRVGVRHGNVEALEDIYWVDPSFLRVTGLPLVAGDAATALDAPDSVVLTRSFARKYFGTDSPIGGTLEFFRKDPMRVTAVIEDPPANSQFDSSILASGRAPFSDIAKEDASQWKSGETSFSGWLYVRLKPGIDPREIDQRFPDFIKRHFPLDNPSDPGNEQLAFNLEPLTDIHLSQAVGSIKAGGNVGVITAVSIVAILIVIIAAINFINLMTARAARRAVEVGVRKALGATHAQLVVQFMSESLTFAAVAALIAIALVELALPSFNAFLDRNIDFAYWHDLPLAAGIAGLVLVVGLGAGIYPALVLSSFRPVSVLKGGRSGGAGGSWLRQALVVLQFAVSIGLAVATLVIVRQTDFATGESLRFDKDLVMLVQGKEACLDAVRDRIEALVGVRAVACSRAAPLDFSISDSTSILPDGRTVEVDSTGIDFGFFELYGLRPLAGRLFDRARPADAVPLAKDAEMSAPLVINETAVRVYGFASPAAAIGQQVTLTGVREKKAPSQIIGVVPDFPIGSIRNVIQPTAFYVDPSIWGLLSVKLDGAHVPEDLAGIDRIWNETVTDRPIRRFFLDAKINEFYVSITKQSHIFAGFAGVALLIGCLGLFGLSAFTAERRTKEIGIRKALGASSFDVVRLLIWQFAKPVLIANAIAWPIVWWIMQRWLDGFAYRVALSWQPFLLAGVVALAIAVLTTGFHAIQVARAKPISALRYE